MASDVTSIYEPLGRAVVILFFVYVTTFTATLYLDFLGVNLPPLVDLTIGFGVVFLSFSYYYYRNPEADI